MSSRRLLHLAAIAVAATLTVAACSQGATDEPGEAATPTTEPDVVSATTSPAAIEPATAVAPAPVPPSTAVPTFTLPPPTVPLPQPVAPPVDDESPEPVVPLGSIAIPALGIDRPLFEGIRLPTFDLGPGHWPGTALPGQVGNMVIGGHRTESNADFRDIDQLQPGSEVIVTDVNGGRYTYLVDSVEITDPFAAKVVYQTPAHTATLFACHPPGSTDRRVVVHLTMVA